MYGGMTEATRLTREGRLAEATALLQRTLGGGHAPSDAPAGRVRSLPPDTGAGPAATRAAEADKAAPPEAPAPDETAADAPESAAPQTGTRPSVKATVRRVPTGRPSVSPPVPPVELRIPGRDGLPGRGPFPRRTPADVAGPGRWIAETHTSAAGTRDYKLYIPSGCNGQSLPLVVMLHGCTQTPDDFAAGTAMNAAAEGGGRPGRFPGGFPEGFLVAYPAQAAAANTSRCWNWFQPAHQRRDVGEPALIAGITRQVITRHGADPDRVYVAGLSSGGAMAAILGLTYPDLYAAVGVHSGLAAGSARDLPSALQAMRRGGAGGPLGQTGPAGVGRPPPLILFHGDGDSTVHPCNADHLLRQWLAASGSEGQAGSTPPAAVRQGQAAGGRAYTREVYRDGHGQPVVERWTIHGAGHAWSGGSRSGSYTDAGGPDATGEFVRFFRENATGPLPSA